MTSPSGSPELSLLLGVSVWTIVFEPPSRVSSWVSNKSNGIPGIISGSGVFGGRGDLDLGNQSGIQSACCMFGVSRGKKALRFDKASGKHNKA